MSVDPINPYKKFFPLLKDNIDVPLSTVIQEYIDTASRDINCVKIGTIQSFDATNQTATILIAFKKVVYVDTRSSEVDKFTELIDYPLLVCCPCFTYAGGNSYISMPIAVNDSCLVLFNDRDIDNWFYQGNGQIPNTYRIHDLSDGFALVGFRNDLNKIADYLSNGIKIKYNTDNRIEMTNGLTESFVALFRQTGDMNIVGNLSVTGNITATGDITAGFGGASPITLLGHKHSNGGGVGNSGTPVP